MKILKMMGWASALCLSAMTLTAQETNEVRQLKKQLQQMQENFEKVRREQQQQLEALTRKFDELMQASPKVAAEATQEKTPEQKQLEQQLAAELGEAHDNIAPKVQTTDPIRVKRGNAYMDIGLIGTFAAGTSTADDIEGGLQLGGHDPNQRGFTVQGLEATFSGAIDPYFRGNANILFSIDSGGESFLELEEAWLETISLPGNLQIRGGQYLTDFGRQNTMHPHSWGFVDAPLATARLLGPDGLRNPGARVSWLAPTPFYSELFFGLQNSHGETASSFRSSGHSHGDEESEGLPIGFRHPDNDRGVRGVDDLLISARYAASVDLTDEQTILAGASAVFGPNSSGQRGNTDTQIYGIDLTWKWRPANHNGGFPFFTWQSEALLRKFRAGVFDWDEEANLGDADGNGNPDEDVLVNSATGLPAVLPSETLTDYGFYSQISYGFKKGWVAGLRYDYVASDRADYERRPLILADNAGGGMVVGRDPFRDSRWRISPNLTWFPTEFSKLRLQYNYDDRRDIGVDHSVWLQFEFLLGAHGAHKF